MNLYNTPYLHSLSGPILITGHTGFKGTWMTLLLEKLGIDVVGYSLAPEKDSLFERTNRSGAIAEKFADIREHQELNDFINEKKPSAVIHMAAQPLVLESYRIPRETFEINVMGTVNLLNSVFAGSTIEAAVIVTTDKVYRNDNSGQPFIESDPLSGKDPYSASKVCTEAVVAAWQQIAKISGGPKVVSVRAGNVIGGGDWAFDRLLPDLVRSFISGTKISVRNPSHTRPWQHVLDPLSGYLLTLEAVLRGDSIHSINFGPDSQSLKVAQIVEIACKTWGNETLIDLFKTVDRNSPEANSLQLNAGFARDVLQWTPFWSQEEAVVETIEWWVQVINLGMQPIDACNMEINRMLGK